MQHPWRDVTAVVKDWLPRCEPGQGLAEYAVALEGVALAVLLCLFVLGARLGMLLDRAGKTLG